MRHLQQVDPARISAYRDGALRGPLRRCCERALRTALHLYWRFARGLTLGVRALVIDHERRVFLIRHTYVAGWQLPGGGVEVGETVHEALARELREEGNIELIEAQPPRLFGVYFNRHISRRDHVMLFVVHDFRQTRTPVPTHEIAAHGFFALDDLPADTTAGTRARIAEVLLERAPSPDW